jgi:hypothetical protein
MSTEDWVIVQSRRIAWALVFKFYLIEQRWLRGLDSDNYPWGKKGSESLATKYAASTPGVHFKLDESKEYAEVC